eukprot:COSAG01_NODE_4611_length_4879_cov_9.632845_3_plen_851_part_01
MFMTLHHLYMTRYSVYCVLFDMRQLVPDVDTRFPGAFPAVPVGVSPTKHALSVLRFWLNSIVVHTRDESGSCSPLVIVGTHKDLVPSAQDHRAISDLLDETFGTHPAWQSLQCNRETTADPSAGGQKTLLWFFPLDNLKGPADPVFNTFLKAVENAVRAEDYVHRRVPIPWYRMYDALQGVLAAKQPTLSFARAVELARDAGLPVSLSLAVEKEVRAELCFLHQLGILMYFDEPGLDDIIVLDPQWLVTAATRIICEFSIHFLPEHEAAMKTMSKSWNALKKRAELNIELLTPLWPEHDDDAKRQLLQLMAKFGLITPQRQRSVFLVPSLLRDANSDALYAQAAAARAPARDCQHTAYFVFCLRDHDGAALIADDSLCDMQQLNELGFLPNGLFPRVVGKCVAWSQSTHGAAPTLNSSNCIFAFGGDRFMLNELPDRNAIRLVLFQDNVVACERVAALIKDVLAECMPHLCYQIMLPAPALDPTAVDTTGYPPREDGYLVPLELVRVAASTEGSAGGIWTGHKQSLQHELQSEYSLWLPSVGKLQSYDIMLSYRHAAKKDTACALKLFDGCGSDDFVFGERRRNLRVFLDRVRLSVGSRFMEDIMHAMLHSRVICPVVSASATLRMETMTAKPEAMPTSTFSIWIEGIGRMTNAEMSKNWEAVRGQIPHSFELGCHYTTRECADKIIGGVGLRASTAGQLGGGVSVCKVGPHVFNWDQYGGGDFCETTGRKLWGEKWADVLPGNKDHDKLEVCLWVKIPKKVFSDMDRVVPGREDALIIPTELLLEQDGQHWLQKERIVKAYQLLDLKPAKAVAAPTPAPAPTPASKPSRDLWIEGIGRMTNAEMSKNWEA